MNRSEEFIDIALRKARESLKSGNSGFGAVVARDGVLVSAAHDTDKTSGDPTAHAEITAIRIAADRLGGDFSRCMLVSTHEPCPMCAAAALWAGIKQIAYGYSIRKAIAQGRRRIDLGCRELFRRAGASVEVTAGVHEAACAVLYDPKVRQSVKQLRNADPGTLSRLSESLRDKRIEWFKRQKIHRGSESDLLGDAYRLFLLKLGIDAADAPIAERSAHRLVIHSKNFCPTLEACTILDLDTRVVCRQLSETPTQALLQQLDPSLRFTRNYRCIRPYGPYCEEMISIEPIGHGTNRSG